MKAIRKILCVLISAVFIAIQGFPLVVSAAEENVRVGYMDYDGFINPMSDGTYSGYAADYLVEISKYTGYKYEYVHGNWTDLLEQLEKGEIDLLCSAQYTKERGEIFDFTEYPIGYTQGLLYTTTTNDKLFYEDYAGFNGMNTGMLKDSIINDIFLKYAEMKDFSCNYIEYDNQTAMLSALENGEIDAMCTEHIANHTGLSLLAKFGADAFYIMSYKGSDLIPEINFALQQVKSDVDFEADLFHKYYDGSSAATSLQFTVEEKEFIQSLGEIDVALNVGRAPFSEYNEKTGEFSGICVDVLNEISEKSGIKFNFKQQTLGKTVPELLSSTEYDMICGIERDNFTSNEIILSTDSFMESTIVPVGNRGVNININSDIVAAIPSSFQALKKKLEAAYPNMVLSYYKTNRECLDAVIAGEADVFIQNTHILSLLLQEPKYEKLDILPVEIMTEHTAIAIPRSADPLLESVINKSIANIDGAVISGSLIEHTFASPYDYTIGDFVRKFKVQIIIIGILLAICFALLIGVAMLRRHNELKLQKKNVLLADAVAQADSANVAKSQFLSRMSHEIRTPMNAIVGLTEIAKGHKNDPEKMEDYLSKIEVSSKVLLKIINDVLDMSAIESNKLKLANAEFDIKHVLTSLSTIYYPQCQNKGIKFEMATDLENEIFVGDSLRVNQVLMNLVSNAYKFTEEGDTISIFVKETARKDKTAFLRFIISDTGCGMSDEMKERLFKPFEQEAADTAKKHGGSGLGLSIAKNLVDMMHGAINVESEKNKGTTFTVDLPFGVTENKSEMYSDKLSSIRVLTVDDDLTAREYTSIVLTRLGVKFESVSSGKEALEKIQAAEKQGNPYDVCLIDWKMPDMDGVDVTRHIREKNNNNILIIIVSAYDLNEVEDSAKAAGANYFVTKPLFQSTIFNVLMTLTNGEMKEETAAPEDYDFTGHKVLLAEDQQLNAEIAMELLGIVNMAADHVENGQKAVEKFNEMPKGTYAAILMDVQMPILDGYEATKAIRELERPDAKTIPIYAMTANAFTEDVAAALSAGMNGHIAKPIDTEILYHTLYEAVKKQRLL